MNKAIIIIVGVVLIVASFAFGVFWGEKVNTQGISLEAKQIDQLKQSNLLQTLSFGVNGLVYNIDGRTITIDKEGKRYSVNIDTDAKIMLITATPQDDGTMSSESEEISFDSIKLGDNATIMISGNLDDGIRNSGKIVTI
jgi:hypothetical protein